MSGIGKKVSKTEKHFHVKNKNQSFGRKGEEPSEEPELDCYNYFRSSNQVRVRLSFNSNRLYIFDFEFNMNWGNYENWDLGLEYDYERLMV